MAREGAPHADSGAPAEVASLGPAPLVLAFDTAGPACSVAIGRGDSVLAHERRDMRHGHAEALLPMIDRVVAAAKLGPDDIDCVAVSVGPGGFTGIRAGLAVAHGLTLATGARLFGVSSLAAVAALVPIAESRLLVALDSRRADLYVQLFDRDGAPRTEPMAILPENLAGWVGDGVLRIAGDAAEAAAAALAQRPRIEIVPGSAPDACGVLAAVRHWPALADPIGQPVYLRPPDVSLPKPGRGAR
jgi:tRNA threonylcarbamoyladenosine biosynthesis protein TsaB